MTDPKIFAQNEVLRIRNEIEALDRSFPATPDGHLKCSKRGGRKCYYIVKTEGGVRRARYIPADQMDIAEAMAMRDYLTRKRRLLDQDLKCMEMLPECYSGRCGIDAAESMNPDHFALIKDSVFPAEDELAVWQNAPYEKNSKYPEALVHRTISGVMVRSKSESIIADQLFSRGIPFRYEAQLMVCGREFYPDFLILHPRDWRPLIWEHFGLMSSETYRESTVRKLALYFEAGFKLGRDLVATFEWEDLPLDSSAVAKLIEHCLEQ